MLSHASVQAIIKVFVEVVSVQIIAVSLSVSALILAAYTIFSSLSDKEWKIKELKKSSIFKNFLISTINTGAFFILIFMASVVFASFKNFVQYEKYVFSYLYLTAYIALLLFGCLKLYIIFYRLKQITGLSDGEKKRRIFETPKRDDDD